MGRAQSCGPAEDDRGGARPKRGGGGRLEGEGRPAGAGRRRPRGRARATATSRMRSTNPAGRGNRLCHHPPAESVAMATTEDKQAARRRDRAVAERALRGEPRAQGRALLDHLRPRERAALHARQRAEVDYERDLGFPGVYPFTRGVYPSMYRGKLWTMRQFAGLRHRRGDERALPLPARRTARRGSRRRSTCRR